MKLRYVVAAAICVLAAIYLLTATDGGKQAAPAAGGGPLQIRLVGVQPDCGDDIYDAAGKKIGQATNVSHASGSWGSERMQRDFIFEMPAIDKTFLPIQMVQIDASGAERSVGSGHFRRTRLGPNKDKQRLVLSAGIKRKYRGNFVYFFSREYPVERIDMTLKYYYGEKGEADFSFNGPFEAGKKVQDDGGAGYFLTPQETMPMGSEIAAAFHLSTKNPDYGLRAVVAYDKSGSRHLVTTRSGSRGSGGIELDYVVDGIELEDIASIAFNEKPHEQTFKNIAVVYPNRPARDHAEYLDKMAERLGLTGLSGKELAQYSLQSPEEALDVIDIVRGYHYHRRQALEQIKHSRPSIEVAHLDEQTRERIHTTAREWAGCDDMYIRCAGIELGLIGQWPEFFDMAMEMFKPHSAEYAREWGDRRTMINATRDMAWTLQRNCGQLEPEQVQRIKEVICQTDNGSVLRRLVECLGKTKSQAAVNAWRELAEDDRPWIWWHATGVWFYNVRKDLDSFDGLSEKMKLRLILTKGVPEDEELKAEAYAMLPELLTPELARMASYVWNDVREKIARQLDKKTATKAFAGFLRAMETDLNRQRWASDDIYRNSLKWMVAYVVRHLNVWYGVDIGGLGKEESSESWKTEPKNISEFRALLSEVLTWYDENRQLEPVEPALAGRVIDTGGRGIEGAVLSFTMLENFVDEKGHKRQRRVEAGRCETDVDGDFRIVLLPANTPYFDLNVSAAGYMTREGLVVQRLADGRCRYLPGGPIELQQPGKISGKAIGADGGPLADTRLKIFSNDRYSPDKAHRELKTDAQGQFVLENVSAGYHLLHYHKHKRVKKGESWRHQYGGICGARVLEVKEGQSLEDVVLDLTKSTCSLEVEITDASGNPVKEVTLWLQAQMPAAAYPFGDIFNVYVTDSRGLYRFGGLPAIKGYVLVHSDEVEFGDKVEVELVDGQTTRCQVKAKDSLRRGE